MIIDRFEGDFWFLSNFSDEGGVRPTVEHWYQAAKTDDPEWQERILTARDPGQAKKIGRKCPIVANWDDIRIDVMRDLLYDKFEEPEIRQKLIETKTAELIEGNTWGDDFWGMCTDKGENHLGKLLEEVRAWCRSIT